MKAWHIWDFPDTTYLSLKDEFREEFFSRMFKEVGGKRPYAKFLGIGQKTVKQYAQGYSHKSGIKHPQAIPLSVFKKSLPLIDYQLKERIEENIKSIKAKNKGKPVLNLKLPFRESPALYRIVAHVIGDGSAPGNKVPYYANTCIELREQFKKDLNIFGEMDVYERVMGKIPVVYFPKVITDILSYILNVKFSYPDRIPSQIFQSSEDCKFAFLQALFDDEGTMSTNLAISMSNFNIIEEIKNLTESVGVATGKISKKENNPYPTNFSLSIKRKCLKEFDKKISFAHPKKLMNLNASITSKSRKQRTRQIEDIDNQILNFLNNSKKTTLEVANEIKLTLGYTLRLLKRLEVQNKISRSGFKNRIFWLVNYGRVHLHS